jgi:hypothetical protein
MAMASIEERAQSLSRQCSPCPSCGYRATIDGDFCGPCRERRAVEDYLVDDAPVIKRRQEDGEPGPSSADALRERQRRCQASCWLLRTTTSSWYRSVSGPTALVPKRRGRSWATSPHPLEEAFPLADVAYPEGQKE